MHDIGTGSVASHFSNARQDCPGRIAGRRTHLVDEHTVRPEQHQISEGAARVHPNPDHGFSPVAGVVSDSFASGGFGGRGR